MDAGGQFVVEVQRYANDPISNWRQTLPLDPIMVAQYVYVEGQMNAQAQNSQAFQS
jgi:hypothetical protein